MRLSRYSAGLVAESTAVVTEGGRGWFAAPLRAGRRVGHDKSFNGNEGAPALIPAAALGRSRSSEGTRIHDEEHGSRIRHVGYQVGGSLKGG